MKKNFNYITSETRKSSLNKNKEIDKIKTTNVNILLNRVRLDKKKTLKKKIFFSVILITLVGSLAAYFVI